MSGNGNVEQHIENEVQRRLAARMRDQSNQVAELHSVITDCKNKLIQQRAMIESLQGSAFIFGTVMKANNTPDTRVFRTNDEVFVIDPNSPHFRQGGRIISGLNGGDVVDAQGRVLVQLTNEQEVSFSMGLNDPAQITLSTKSDGTTVIVSIEGKPWEVKGNVALQINAGDCVKIHPESKQIVEKADPIPVGPICRVLTITDQGIEVANKGETVLVFNPEKFPLESGDRVVCDPGMLMVVEKLPEDSNNRYKVSGDFNVTWNDVGGLDDAKRMLREAIEMPFRYPDKFAFYKVQPLRGILLFGPPGCGKTMLARVCVNAIATVHGKQAVESGYIFVKGPEILDKWVGNSEQEIRNLFERGRRHYRAHGYKAILAIDEADAILPQRGMRRSSDVADTIVPMFLGEMDGIDDVQTEENPIVLLMTNRADILDPAVTRPGRINRHIKIDRPDECAALDILDIHTKEMPFADPENRMQALAVTLADFFSKTRLMYRVNEHVFTLGDSVNGAMIANLAEMAKMKALHRDIESDTCTGVSIQDLRESVNDLYHQQRGLNHSYDLNDFAERLGIQPSAMSVERCFGNG